MEFQSPKIEELFACGSSVQGSLKDLTQRLL